MGQIFNRLVNYVKSEVGSTNTRSTQSVIDEKDNDLKRIIDELNKSKKDFRSEQKKESSKGKAYNPEPQTMSISKAFEILGVQQNSSIDEIKSAFKKKVMEYHPDRVAALGDELKELAGKKTLQINEAYSLIRKTRTF